MKAVCVGSKLFFWSCFFVTYEWSSEGPVTCCGGEHIFSLMSPGVFVYNRLDHHFTCMVASSQMEVKLLHLLFTVFSFMCDRLLLCTHLLGAAVCVLLVPCVFAPLLVCVAAVISHGGETIDHLF